MKVSSIHERHIQATPEEWGHLLSSLASANDRLWPHERWMPMHLEPSLTVGARGGHGPIRYAVVEHVPEQKVVFQFSPRRGRVFLQGIHYFEGHPQGSGFLIRHVIDARASLGAFLKWKLLIEPLHDALIEDAFDKVQKATGPPITRPSTWGPRVRMIRWLMQFVLKG